MLTAVLLAAGCFFSYVVHVIVQADFGPWALLAAGTLVSMQSFTLVLLLVHTFEILDVVCRVSWRRQGSAKIVPGFSPSVSLHVPTHNEPPELVIETLDALARLDYPNFEVIVVDNNTADEKLWRPVEEHCRKLGRRFRFFHLMPWPGYQIGRVEFCAVENGRGPHRSGGRRLSGETELPERPGWPLQ